MDGIARSWKQPSINSLPWRREILELRHFLVRIKRLWKHGSSSGNSHLQLCVSTAAADSLLSGRKTRIRALQSWCKFGYSLGVWLGGWENLHGCSSRRPELSSWTQVASRDGRNQNVLLLVLQVRPTYSEGPSTSNRICAGRENSHARWLDQQKHNGRDSHNLHVEASRKLQQFVTVWENKGRQVRSCRNKVERGQRGWNEFFRRIHWNPSSSHDF